MTFDLDTINAQLREKAPEEIIRWALSLGKRVIATTSFGPNSAVLLKLVSEADQKIPVVWVDHGYNVRDAYRVAEQLMQQLDLDMHVYTPLVTQERRNAVYGGVPSIDEPEAHEKFTREVKLEPFARALSELQPEVWITGIRHGDTEHRRSLDIVSMDNRGLIKVAPIFYWSDDQVATFMEAYQLPSCAHYFDPTKVHDHRECGLHTAA